MRFTIQQFKATSDSESIPGVFIELDSTMDLPQLFREGHITTHVADEDGTVVQQICLYLRGRGINPDKFMK